jgi:AraC family transcriptional regulator of adaptative response/methylated-DNA-[protein]-cysteine methyltransferase
MNYYESMTPGEYKLLSMGLTINYGIFHSPFGLCLIATTQRGICKLAFFDTQDEQQQLKQELHSEWSNTLIIQDQDHVKPLFVEIFEKQDQSSNSLKLLLKGSPFQLKVWGALLTIPKGHLTSYQQVSNVIGKPSACRAVASAIAKNSIAYLIPCHRVIKKNGDFGQYRWGDVRKKKLIAREANQ